MITCRSEVSGGVASVARMLSVFALAMCVSFAVTPMLFAQVTTGSLAGQVLADADGAALPGVTIEAVYVPTGTHYATVSGANGRYVIPNVRVGGPYTITATLEGFKTTTLNNLNVNLGQTSEIPVKMKLAGVSETVTVTAKPDDIINPTHTGSSTEVQQKQIEQLPTVNRSLQDFARTNPYFDVSPTDSSGTTLNIAGRNNRYNNIQIDGAVNNDLFGLAGTGTPGGQTGTQPIPLDSLQALQLVVSPYDVRQSGFTGGGINAVTKSGTNKWDGSAFGTKRSRSYVGNGPNDTPFASFKQTQWGGRLGGPIIQDKLFFFVSGEENRRNQPNGTFDRTVAGIDPSLSVTDCIAALNGATNVYCGTGTGATPGLGLLANFAKTAYNYDPGSLADVPFGTNSNLAFGRLDFNLNNNNTITVRHNYVNGTNDVSPSSYPSTRTTTRYWFPSSIYSIADVTRSSVAQINTVFSANMFNEGRFGYQTIRDKRAIPIAFPTVEIGGTGERNGAVQIGTERFSAANFLNQNIREFTDDFTIVKGGHTIVLGTHDEKFDFKNLFISDNYGYYYFPTLDAFEQNKPTIYRIGYATGDDPRRPAAFGAGQYSLYANDQWRFNNNWTFTFGLRGDKPHFSSVPNFNPAVQATLGYSTSAIPAEKVVWEPRVGFNWDPFADGKQQLRGGIGVFQGRAPYVWISNAYSGTGIDIVNKGCLPPACAPPAFNPDITQQPRLDNVAGAAVSVALTDPNFRFPRVLRSTLGYDRDLWWGIKGTVEGLYSKTQSDIFYRNVNLAQSGVSPLDGRPTYSRITTAGISDVILLTDAGMGSEFTQTLQLNKTFTNLTISASYAHQHAASVFDGGSSVAFSNWQFEPNQGDVNKKQLATSSYQVRHRFNIAATYNLTTGPLTHNFGVYYDAEAGGAYSLLMGGDPNHDFTQNDDLLYVPANVIVCSSGSTVATCVANAAAEAVTPPAAGSAQTRWTQFLQSVGVDPNKSQSLTRNSLQQPWVRRMDVHYELGLPQWRDVRVLVTGDVLNFLNMFNKENGAARFVSNGTYTTVTYVGQDPATNKPVYREAAPGRLNVGNQLSVAEGASRWQARLGLRVNF